MYELSDNECDQIAARESGAAWTTATDRAFIRAGYAAGLAAAQAAMPPRELTQAMLDAGSLVFMRKRQDYIPKWEPSIAGDFWRAMYDAWTQEQTSGPVMPLTRGVAERDALLAIVRAADAMYATADHTGGNPGCCRCDAADDYLAARAKVKP